MVRSPRLPRQQRRNSVADDQHHRDRRGDHRSGPGGQRPWSDPGDQARRARHASRRAPAASSISAAWRDTAAAFRPTSIQPRKAPSARLPVPPQRSWAKREFASTRISPGAIVTGIFGKNAGLEGSKADQVAGVVKEIVCDDPADPARRPAGRYRASGGVSCQRRVRVRQRPGHRHRRRADGGHTGMVVYGGRAGGNGERIKAAAAAL